MQAKREYRRRDDTEVAVLDALVDRNSEGMTVFEIRSHVDADIDEIEDALSSLKNDGLISADKSNNRTVITVDKQVIPDEEDQEREETSILDAIRRKLGL